MKGNEKYLKLILFLCMVAMEEVIRFFTKNSFFSFLVTLLLFMNYVIVVMQCTDVRSRVKMYVINLVAMILFALFVYFVYRYVGDEDISLTEKKAKALILSLRFTIFLQLSPIHFNSYSPVTSSTPPFVRSIDSSDS